LKDEKRLGDRRTENGKAKNGGGRRETGGGENGRTETGHSLNFNTPFIYRFFIAKSEE
jgi:hypothetical protein